MSRPPVSGLLVVLLLAGCTAAPTPTATPLPTPTYQCTPEAGGSPAPCSQSEHEAMVKKDAQYAEAERVYRQVFALDEDLYASGKEATPELLEYMTGSAVAESKEVHAGVKYVSGRSSLVWVKRLVGEAREGSVVALQACVDGSNATYQEDGVTTGPGLVGIERAYFVPSKDGASLRITAFDYVEATSC